MEKTLRLIRNEVILNHILTGKNDSEISKIVNLGSESIRKIRLKNNIISPYLLSRNKIEDYPEDLVGKIIELNNSGLCRREIGIILNMKSHNIESILSKKKIYSCNKNTHNKSIEFTQNQKDMLVGLILGDGYISNKGFCSYLKIDHCLQQDDYSKFIFNNFNNIFKNILYSTRKKADKRTGKYYSSVSLQSLSTKQLREYRNLFYKNNKKIIPENIYDLITPAGLAHLFMDDGKAGTNGFYICTENFTKNENLLLIDSINKKFNLNLKISKQRKIYYRIYIPSKEKENFIELVKPFMIPSMYYKLNCWRKLSKPSINPVN